MSVKMGDSKGDIDPEVEVRKLQDLVRKLEKQNELLRSKKSNIAREHQNNFTSAPRYQTLDLQNVDADCDFNGVESSNLKDGLLNKSLEDVELLDLDRLQNTDDEDSCNYTQVKRGGEEVKKKYKNILQSATKRADAAKHPKTGGGRKEPPLTAAEELVLAGLEGRPVLDGLAEGVDTAEEVAPTGAVQVLDLPIQIDNRGMLTLGVSGAQRCPVAPAPSSLGSQPQAWSVLQKCLQESQEEEEQQEEEEEAATTSALAIVAKVEKPRKKRRVGLNDDWYANLKQVTRTARAQEELCLLKTKVLRRDLGLTEPDAEA